MPNGAHDLPGSLPEPGAVSPISVVLVDDHQAFLDIVRRFLVGQPDQGIKVLGHATTGAAGLALARQLRPEVVLVDLMMSGLTGLDVVKSVKQHCPQTRIVVLTMMEEASYRAAARNAGAHEFVTKAALSTDLLPAIRRARPAGAPPAAPAGIPAPRAGEPRG